MNVYKLEHVKYIIIFNCSQHVHVCRKAWGIGGKNATKFKSGFDKLYDTSIRNMKYLAIFNKMCAEPVQGKLLNVSKKYSI